MQRLQQTQIGKIKKDILRVYKGIIPKKKGQVSVPVIITYVMTNYISYTELDFLNHFFLYDDSVQPLEAYASIIILFLSGLKPRTIASSSQP